MQNTDILSLFNQLIDFQKEKIQRELSNNIQFNETVESSHDAFCPICVIQEPKIIKKVFLYLGQELVQCVNRAKPSSKEVIQVFGSVIKEQSILINDGLFSNYDRIQQNKLSSMVVSDQQTLTPIIHLNTVNSMHSGFKKLYRHFRVYFHHISQSRSRFICLLASFYRDGQSREVHGFSNKSERNSQLLYKAMVKSLNLLQV